jgi:hypothetical protein
VKTEGVIMTDNSSLNTVTGGLSVTNSPFITENTIPLTETDVKTHNVVVDNMPTDNTQNKTPSFEDKNVVVIEKGQFKDEEGIELNDVKRSMTENNASMDEDAISMDEDAISMDEDAISMDEDAISMDEDAISMDEDAISMDENAISVNKETISINKEPISINKGVILTELRGNLSHKTTFNKQLVTPEAIQYLKATNDPTTIIENETTLQIIDEATKRGKIYVDNETTDLNSLMDELSQNYQGFNFDIYLMNSNEFKTLSHEIRTLISDYKINKNIKKNNDQLNSNSLITSKDLYPKMSKTLTSRHVQKFKTTNLARDILENSSLQKSKELLKEEESAMIIKRDKIKHELKIIEKIQERECTDINKDIKKRVTLKREIIVKESPSNPARKINRR